MITPAICTSIYCQVRTPKFRNGIVDLFVYQWGYIDTETWRFKGEKHDINFKTEDKFKTALVQWV